MCTGSWDLGPIAVHRGRDPSLNHLRPYSTGRRPWTIWWTSFGCGYAESNPLGHPPPVRGAGAGIWVSLVSPRPTASWSWGYWVWGWARSSTWPSVWFTAVKAKDVTGSYRVRVQFASKPSQRTGSVLLRLEHQQALAVALVSFHVQAELAIFCVTRVQTWRILFKVYGAQ